MEKILPLHLRHFQKIRIQIFPLALSDNLCVQSVMSYHGMLKNKHSLFEKESMQTGLITHKQVSAFLLLNLVWLWF